MRIFMLLLTRCGDGFRRTVMLANVQDLVASILVPFPAIALVVKKVRMIGGTML